MKSLSLLLCVAVIIPSCQSGTKRGASRAPTQIHLPGAAAYSAELSKRLREAVVAKGADYKPRTRHLRADGTAKFINRLITQSSPYLTQHAHNPVNWYPWGDEAFEAAARLDRPVLLSIGYSTCHWCHVMEEESFEDIETARYLNENFVVIKVDREERPDVDSIYMSAVHAMGISGGWPLNVFLTASRRPFYGGTYFPPDGRGGRPGFVSVLKQIKRTYDEDRDKALRSAQDIAKQIRRMTRPPAGTTTIPGTEVLDVAASYLGERFDSVYGGLSTGRRGTKFPSSFPNRFLLRYALRSGDAKYSEMAIFTLDKMAAGGMYDQAGGGFHRYSTDPRWQVPHFEKMLYDNALLASAYTEAFLATGGARHEEVARQILAYAVRDMQSDKGAFFSASDADSIGPGGEREEGYYYTWTPDEIRVLLGPERAKLVIAYFGVTPQGNFEGRNILHVDKPLGQVAKAQGISEVEAKKTIAEARETLYEARQRRPAPNTDDKILVAWNGLMISAFAQASRALGPDLERHLQYREIAERAANFILNTMRRGPRLLRSSLGGRAHLAAYVDDYAFFIAALLDLYSATGDSRWVGEAIALQEQLDLHYADSSGGYFMTADDQEKLLTREKSASDGAIPSGNSYAILNLLRLYQLTGKLSYRNTADAALRAFGQALERNPLGLSEMLLALDFRTDEVKQVVIVAPPGGSASALATVANSAWNPNSVYVETTEGKALDKLSALVPLVEDKLAIGGRATAYVCEDTHCELPTNSVETFRKQLSKVTPLHGSQEAGSAESDEQ